MRTLVPENVIIDGHRLAHGRHGTGEPVVLVHGTPSSSYLWRNALPTLLEADGLEVFLELISGPVGQASLFQHQIAHYDARHTLEIGDRLAGLG